jgi:hypothetical protein
MAELAKERTPFKCLKGANESELLIKLNELALLNYEPIWSTLNQQYAGKDHNNMDRFELVLFLYDADRKGLDPDEISKRSQISKDILLAERHVAEAQSALEELEYDLRMSTDWSKVKKELEEQNGVKLGKLLVDDKKGYIAAKTKLKREWLGTCQRWLAHVKRLEKIHERAGIPPWNLFKDGNLTETEGEDKDKTGLYESEYLKKLKKLGGESKEDGEEAVEHDPEGDLLGKY